MTSLNQTAHVFGIQYYLTTANYFIFPWENNSVLNLNNIRKEASQIQLAINVQNF